MVFVSVTFRPERSTEPVTLLPAVSSTSMVSVVPSKVRPLLLFFRVSLSTVKVVDLEASVLSVNVTVVVWVLVPFSPLASAVIS